MPAPTNPYKPYEAEHQNRQGPGDARPTSMQVLKDLDGIGKLKGKICLITGCSAGIGIETARALYEAGATLYLTARDLPKLDGIIDDIVKNAEYNKDGPKPQAIEMHLDDLDSVKKGADDFKQKSAGKLNILITNAGVMACPYATTKNGLEMQLGVNHFAHFLLFQLLRPCLLASAKESGSASRVIILSSAGHRRTGITFDDKSGLDAWNQGEGYEKWLAYGQSKTANIYMANAIHRRDGSSGIVAVSVHPGGIRTELSRHLSEDELGRFNSDDFKHIYKNASQGAATTVWAALSPHFEGKNGGQYLEDVGESSPGKPNPVMGDPGFQPHAYDEEKEERLWKVSCDVVGVEDA